MNRIIFYTAGIVAVIGAVAVIRWSMERPMRDLLAETERDIAEFKAKTKAATKLELEKSTGHPCMLGVTRQAYEMLTPGMSEARVRIIIGESGVEQSSIGTAVTKCWQENGSAIVVTFQDGALVGKSQVGL